MEVFVEDKHDFGPGVDAFAARPLSKSSAIDVEGEADRAISLLESRGLVVDRNQVLQLGGVREVAWYFSGFLEAIGREETVEAIACALEWRFGRVPEVQRIRFSVEEFEESEGESIKECDDDKSLTYELVEAARQHGSKAVWQ